MDFSEEEAILEKGIYYLNKHIIYSSVNLKKGVTAIRDLYDLVDSDRYEGVIYRGIGVEVSKVRNLLRNNVFSTTEQDNLIESWSMNEKYARRFALSHTHIREKDMIGVVLKSSTHEEPVIFDMSDAVYEELQEMLERWGEITFSNKYRERECEVLVEHTGEQEYTYCEDVIGITVAGSMLGFELKFEKLFAILSEKMSERDKKRFQMCLNVEIPVYLTCNDSGSELIVSPIGKNIEFVDYLIDG